VQETSGTTVLDQDRDHNHVNEIDVDDDHGNAAGASITASTGTNWYDPTYDAAGNMTAVPKPTNLADGLACTYDAWNRLVAVQVTQTVFMRYKYDGLDRRTTKMLDATSADMYTYCYHNASWQLLETRSSGVAPNPSLHPETLPPAWQYVWSARYIDAPVVQDKNTDGDGLCDDERVYYFNDANFNVTTLGDADGAVVDRYLGTGIGTRSIRRRNPQEADIRFP
jgi:YD repeat-containing protein